MKTPQLQLAKTMLFLFKKKNSKHIQAPLPKSPPSLFSCFSCQGPFGPWSPNVTTLVGSGYFAPPQLRRLGLKVKEPPIHAFQSSTETTYNNTPWNINMLNPKVMDRPGK